jgi:hypothetical protein
MASKSAIGLSEEEIDEIVSMPKFVTDDLEWRDSPTNSNYIAATDTLLDSTGASIPGVFYELQVRRGRYVEECRFEFGVFKLKAGKRYRVYQINVTPSGKRSHKSAEGWWYGPHEHFGHRAHRFDPPLAHGCDHEAWFREFLKRANIRFTGKYLPPTSEQLF